jgi:anti-sigma factor ChrR (cupin superfamily)
LVHVKNIYDEAGWENADGYPKGTLIKTLRDEDGMKTILLKLPAGFNTEAHSHIFNEQHFVLKGEYESEGKLYSEGTYRLINAHKNHGPFTSKKGAVVLIIWDSIK